MPTEYSQTVIDPIDQFEQFKSIRDNDLPAFERTGNEFYDQQRATMRHSLQQGVSRGVIDNEQALKIWEQDDRNWVEKVFGFEASGSRVLQPLTDVLLLGNYAVASLAKARTQYKIEHRNSEDLWENIGAWTIGFSPAQFREAFQERTTFQDVLGWEDAGMSDPRFWGALALDIFLDPVTYLSMGVKPGVQVAVRGSEGAQQVMRHTTRWGTEIWREAAAKLHPELWEKVAKDNKFLMRAGEAPSAWGSGQRLTEFRDKVGAYMVDNYAELAESVAKRLGESKMSGIAGKLDRTINGLPPAEAMFRETAGFLRKERGLWTAGKVEKVLSAISAHVNPLDDFFRKFNQTWGMNDEAKTAYMAVRDSIKAQKLEAQKRLQDVFKNTTETDRKLITHYLENMSADAGARNSVGTVPMNLNDEQLNLAKMVRDEFDDIALKEQRAGILGDKLEDYVTHIFADPKIVSPVMALAKKMGWQGGKGNNFARDRMIASIMDANELFGKDAMLDDIAQILWRRRSASIDMIGKKRMNSHFKALYGVANINFPKELAKHLKANRHDAEIISDIDQVWALPEFDVSKFGFKQGRSGFNRKVMQWLTDGSRDEIPKWLSEEARLTPAFNGNIKTSGFELNINELLDHIYMGAPLAEGKVAKTQMAALVRKADELTRKKMGAPLLTVFEDLEAQLRKMYPARSKSRDSFNKLFEHLQRPIEGLKKDAVLPDDLLINARSFRQMAGDITDTVAFDGQHLANTIRMVGEAKLKHGEVSQILEAMFNKSNLKSLTAREGSIFEEWLTRQFSYNADMWSARLDGEGLVRVSFPKSEHRIATTFSRVNESLMEKHLAASNAINDTSSRYNLFRRKASDIRRRMEQIAVEKTGRGITELMSDDATFVALNDEMLTARSEHKAIIEEISKLKQRRTQLIKQANNEGWSKKKRADATREIRNRLKELNEQRPTAWKAADAARSKLVDHRIKLGEQLRSSLGDEYSAAKNTYDSLKSEASTARAALKTEKEKRRIINAQRNVASLQAAQARGENVGRKLTNAINKLEELGGKVEENVTRVIDDLTEQIEKQKYDGRDFLGRAAEEIGPVFSTAKAPHWVEATEWYLPKSIASLLYDINQPLYREETRYLMRAYDWVQTFFKAPLMAPFAEFYKRNAITNVALTQLRCGMSMLNPRHYGDFMRVLAYHIGNNGVDAAKTLKSSVAVGAVAGGSIGAGAGAAAAYHEGEDITGYAERILKGAGAGAAIGTGFVGGSAAATLAGTKGLVKAYTSRGIEALGAKSVRLKGGATYTVKELIEEASKRGVFTTYVGEELFTGMNVARGAKGEVKEAAQQVIHMRDLFRLGELASEIPTRLMLFITTAKETGSLHLAGKATKEYLFDFAKMSTFERRVMRRAIPFYSWVKHALTVSYDSVVKHPGRVGGQLKFVENQNKYADIDPADKPDWLAEKLSVISVNDETGELNVRTNLGLAHEDAVDIVKNLTGGPEHWKKLLSRGPFGVVSGLELAFNVDTFKGGVILPTLEQDSDFESARPFRNSPEWLRAAVGFTIKEDGSEAVDPRFAYLMREVPYSRFINVMRQVYDVRDEGTAEERRKLNYYSLTRSILGEKLYKFDPQTNRYYHDRERLERMAQFLKKMGMIYDVKIYGSAYKKGRPSGGKGGTEFMEPSRL